MYGARTLISLTRSFAAVRLFSFPLPRHVYISTLYSPNVRAVMAGPRANLAVTKDGETYNKLQRPDDFLDRSAGFDQINDRKRERAAVDRPNAGPASGNKRAKTHHTISATNFLQSSNDKHQYRGVGPVSECGMRMTLPVDEEDQHSDDSMGEALAYLRSVR